MNVDENQGPPLEYFNYRLVASVSMSDLRFFSNVFFLMRTRKLMARSLTNEVVTIDLFITRKLKPMFGDTGH